MCSHVPNKGEQIVRYYGYYSNVSRGKQKKQDQDDAIPCILEPDERTSSVLHKRTYARILNNELEYWRTHASIQKEIILEKLGKKNFSKTTEDPKREQLLSRYEKGQKELSLLTSEFASTLQMDAVFFGKKTNEAIKKIKSKDWWDTSEDSII